MNGRRDWELRSRIQWRDSLKYKAGAKAYQDCQASCLKNRRKARIN